MYSILGLSSSITSIARNYGDIGLADNLGTPYQVGQFCSNGLLSWLYLLLSLEYFEVYQASGSQELVTSMTPF